MNFEFQVVNQNSGKPPLKDFKMNPNQGLLLFMLLIGLVSTVHSMNLKVCNSEELQARIKMVCDRVERGLPYQDWAPTGVFGYRSSFVDEDEDDEIDEDKEDYMKILERATVFKKRSQRDRRALSVDEYIEEVCENNCCLLDVKRIANNCKGGKDRFY